VFHAASAVRSAAVGDEGGSLESTLAGSRRAAPPVEDIGSGDTMAGGSLPVDPRGATVGARNGLADANPRSGGLDSRNDAARGPLVRGSSIGRYVIVDELGAGAMGVVHAAYDPQLNRKVAIKLLHPSTDGESAQRRLLREAQAMAQLSHPNIVAVHDVGLHGGRIFLAMEHVVGRTLRDWSGKGRTYVDVVGVMRQAARGLMAAHAKGLVHRDFKPDNVMVGDDGRVRVMDFGLARVSKQELAVTDVPSTTGEPSETELTQRGTLVGTPAYMAPEQYGEDEVGPLADQFSFCVTMYELLYGERPHRGETLVELATSIIEGVLRAPPSSSKVPRWIHAVVERGMSRDPSNRWPSMEALLQALSRDPGRRRRRLAVAGLLGVSIAGGVGWVQFAEMRRVEGCDRESRKIEAVWTPDEREHIRQSMMGTNASFAADTFERTAEWIDDWADVWSAERRAACLGARTARDRATEVGSSTIDCLEEQRDALGSLVGLLAQSDVTTVRNAVQAAASLPRPTLCSDEAFLRTLPPSQAEVAGPSSQPEIRAELSEISTLRALGHYAEAYERARALLERAQEAQAAHSAPDIALSVGQLAWLTGDLEVAKTMLSRAFVDAGASGRDDLAAKAAIVSLGVATARRDEPGGLQWDLIAEMLTRRLGVENEVLAADRLHELAKLHGSMGRFDDAVEVAEVALEIYRSELGTDHPGVVPTTDRLASLRFMQGHVEESERAFEEGLRVREALLGRSHPEVADSLNNLAIVVAERGDFDRALSLNRRALEIRENALGPDHPTTATSMNNLALAHQSRGDLEQAAELHVQALASLEKSLGPEHPQVSLVMGDLGVLERSRGNFEKATDLLGRALTIQLAAGGLDNPDTAALMNNLANVHILTGNLGEAEQMHRELLEFRSAKLGVEHPLTASSQVNLGDVLLHKGELDDAERLYHAALGAIEAAQGEDHRAVADPLTGLAEIGFQRGRLDEAVAAAERALAVLAGGAAPGELAKLEFVLARALAARDSTTTRVVELATRAAEGFRQAGRKEDLERVQRWLEEQVRGEPRERSRDR
jgi:eukaryotic-like serine/threonine-protein kinase